ncbi:nodulation protein NodH [Chachezhania sediminis]|uniref:nodulation protein NodH n=1 Tax=Chachezhania sediminis TaxID=2599291 RepID=UPI00131BA71F|nr:nodulation protein NodH [Chachezhania sediminis]
MITNFDYFVVLAGMRTGSNFLEANLNALDGVKCHGEAFNPHFIGYPKSKDVLGISRAARDLDPGGLISAIRNESGVLGGFRFFYDHDPRALKLALDDPRCAKIVLNRNPLESYVSWKIAQSTGQWILTDVNRRKDGRATFRLAEFEQFLEDLQSFQVDILKALQHSGQTAFHVGYEDLRDLETMNGLAKWLGVDARLDALDSSLIPQNPGPLSAKVANLSVMTEALAKLDTFNLNRVPNFEPRRGPSVKRHVAAARAPLLFLPISGGPAASVERWLAALDNEPESNLQRGMNQKQMRQWKTKHPGHRSFAILRHPLDRIHHVFCTRILATGPGTFSAIRTSLIRDRNAPLPDRMDDPSYSADRHRAGFDIFLGFVAANLAGQTPVRVDPTWASQGETLRGFGEFALPDRILREDELPWALPRLAADVGIDTAPRPQPEKPDGPHTLEAILDSALEARAAEIYQRDYMMFGFETKRQPQLAEG